MKLACVIHRYGADIAGGSEAHCRAIAHRLAARHDVTVLTSCATDYVSWKNQLPDGLSQDGPVRVRRFPVDRPRSLTRFWELSDRVFDGRASDTEHEQWFRENGPSVPGLLEFLARHGREYDRILFWSFRYAPVFFGLPMVADRAILLPTAEDDELIRTSALLGPFFRRPRACLFLTPEERDLVATRCDGPLPPFEIIGTGLEPASPVSESALASLGLPERFLLYVGRVDKNKGCDRLFDAFREYDDAAGDEVSRLPLVLAGPVVLPVPPHPRIRSLGFVSTEVREALLAKAVALVMPSKLESLSIVILEAWNHGTPVVVNARCGPLAGQTRRANGGLWYALPCEFIEAVRYISANPDVARRLGRQGRDYVEREYRWPTVMEKVERILET